MNCSLLDSIGGVSAESLEWNSWERTKVSSIVISNDGRRAIAILFFSFYNIFVVAAVD